MWKIKNVTAGFEPTTCRISLKTKIVVVVVRGFIIVLHSSVFLLRLVGIILDSWNTLSVSTGNLQTEIVLKSSPFGEVLRNNG